LYACLVISQINDPDPFGIEGEQLNIVRKKVSKIK
jgi:hypothetical protein